MQQPGVPRLDTHRRQVLLGVRLLDRLAPVRGGRANGAEVGGAPVCPRPRPDAHALVRPSASRYVHDKESRCVPETEKLTEAYAKEEILKKVSDEELQAEIRAANALHCKIVKIAHGKPTAKLDPHGMKWAVYDPLAQVG